MTASPLLIAVLLLATLVVAVLGIMAVRAAAQRTSYLEMAGHEGEGQSQLVAWRLRANRALRRNRWGSALDQRLQGAMLRMGPADFLLLLSVIAAVVVFLTYGFMGNLGSVVLVIGVFAGGIRFLEQRRRQRVDAFIAQLPDLARVMGSATSAGVAVRNAVDIVARELPDPAASEFREISRQMALGSSLDGGLSSLSERLPSRELNVLIRTLVIQRQSGGALSTSLSHIASTLEARRELRREVATSVSGASFSGFMVIAIGVGSVVVMNLFSPGSLDKLASNLIGQIVLFVSAVLFFIGFLLMRRIAKVEV